MLTSTTPLGPPLTHTPVILFLIYVIFAVLGSLLAFFLRSVAEVNAIMSFSWCSVLAWTFVLCANRGDKQHSHPEIQFVQRKINTYIHRWSVFGVGAGRVLVCREVTYDSFVLAARRFRRDDLILLPASRDTEAGERLRVSSPHWYILQPLSDMQLYFCFVTRYL